MASVQTPETQPPLLSPATLPHDLASGLVVFLVALPLCLGIAVASGADPLSGVLAGIIGGLVVGAISRSHTSVSGPAAGLTAIVAAQITGLGSFEAFLFAVFVAGLMQVGLGMARAGALSAFFPSSVIKGLLAAIGVLLILKQIPHFLGHDNDPEGDMARVQPDDQTTFSEIWLAIQDPHPGAILVGVAAMVLLIVWAKSARLKRSVIPGPLAAVLLGVGVNFLLTKFASGSRWVLEGNHLVQLPVSKSASDLVGILRMADFSQWLNPTVYVSAATIAIVASLETLLNLEAVDKLDKQQRKSPPNRELVAQGVGNIVAGLVGALPVTSVVIRGSVNVNSGSKTKMSAVFHGILLLAAVAVLPGLINLIPLSALAAILLMTGFKLASPALFKQMWKDGRYQFIPFIVTLVAIVGSDLLIGILIGLAVSAFFILNSHLRYPVRQVMETHAGGDVLRIELANQVSFLNRAALSQILDDAPRGSSLLIDASQSDYIDPDVLGLIRDFRENKAPLHDVSVSLSGFRKKYELSDDIQFVDYTTQDAQSETTPQQVLELLKNGNRRFCEGKPVPRNYRRQIDATAGGQSPLAAVLGCIDSRVPAELVFDLGIGDMFSCRVAGNVPGSKSLGSLEFAVCVAGVPLVLVLGHTSCGAVTAAVRSGLANESAAMQTGCAHLEPIMNEIQASLATATVPKDLERDSPEEAAFIDQIAERNVLRTVQTITERSDAIRAAVEEGRVVVMGAMYDVSTGEFRVLESA